MWNRGAELAVSGLEDCCGALVEDLFIKEVMVHGEAGSREEIQDSTMLRVADQFSIVGQRGGIGHVDRYGMTMS